MGLHWENTDNDICICDNLEMPIDGQKVSDIFDIEYTNICTIYRLILLYTA
jgi:hypothetical protein